MQVQAKVNKDSVQEKILLNSVTARANCGEILAVVGPSGSSKTTFLDALAGRIEPKSLKGRILVNGRAMDPAFKRISGYVMQDDNLFPLLTTRETLMFSARLRIPNTMSYAEKAERVDSLIQQLGLVACADTKVGDEKIRGVSGGERRRVSIGVDLIHDPAVLFLDEPTSGLDSTSALQVMQILSHMAVTRQRTVVLTIHQPSYRILETINRLLVMAKGNVIFQGEVQGIISFFIGLGHALPQFVNGVEFALDIIEDYQEQPEGLQQLVKSYQKSQYAKEEQLFIDANPDAESMSMQTHKPSFATSFFSESLVLGHRNLVNILRTPELFFSRIGLMVVVGLTLGTLFLQAGISAKGVSQRLGFFGFTLALFVFTSTEALPVFLNERQIFIRETSRGAYRVSAYVVAQALVILPFLFMLAMLFSCVSYFTVGLAKNAGAFFFFIVVLFLTLAMANAFVAFVATFVPDMTAGNALSSALFSYFFLFSGFFIPRSGIPDYWIWVHYLSIFKYPLEALLQNEFGHLKGKIWNNNMNSNSIMSKLSVGKVHLWLNVFVMILFVIGYRIMFYIALRFKTKNIRK